MPSVTTQMRRKLRLQPTNWLRAESLLKQGIGQAEGHKRSELMAELAMLYVRAGRTSEASRYLSTNTGEIDAARRLLAYGELGARLEKANPETALSHYMSAAVAGIEFVQRASSNAPFCKPTAHYIYRGLNLAKDNFREGEFGQTMRPWLALADELAGTPSCASDPAVAALYEMSKELRGVLERNGV